jgi:hypothetical protein
MNPLAKQLHHPKLRNFCAQLRMPDEAGRAAHKIGFSSSRKLIPLTLTVCSVNLKPRLGNARGIGIAALNEFYRFKGLPACHGGIRDTLYRIDKVVELQEENIIPNGAIRQAQGHVHSLASHFVPDD